METFLERLEKEFSDLESKVNGLRNFLVTPGFQKLSAGNQILLKEQLIVMQSYLGILTVRLELIKK